MNMAIKPQGGTTVTETPGMAPMAPMTPMTPAPLAHNTHIDHVPRAVRWAQAFLAGMIVALSIGAVVAFENLLARDDLVGGSGYVTALVITILVVRSLPLSPSPAATARVTARSRISA